MPCIVYAIIYKFYAGTIILTVFAAFVVYVLLIEFVTIEIGNVSMNTIYPLWTKKTPFSQIRDITIENVPGGNGKRAQCVLLKLVNGKDVMLNSVKEGTIALYASLKNKLETNKAAQKRH
jgi:hypothetical protein